MRPLRVVALVVVALAVVGLAGTACGHPVADIIPTPPVVAIIGPSSALIGASVAFDSSASDDGAVASLTWDFGDGASATGATASHAWAVAGGYVVTLTAVDNDGNSGSATLVVTVEGPHPTATATVSTTTASVLGEITFDASASTGPAPIASYAWSFDDGAHATTAVATHAYANSGTYHASVTITDDNGATDEATFDITVTPVDTSGTWTLATTPSVYACPSFDASFPDATLTFTSGVDGTITAAGQGGRVYTGTLSGATITVTGRVTQDAGSCGSAPVDVTLTGDIQGDAFTGHATAYFDLDIGCQCSAGFTVTASH